MLKLYNSLTRQLEPFKPIKENHVGLYTCGPTVYQFAHIGNFRAYATADLLVRTLRFDGYDVKFVMNITDVGHLTGDNAGDADSGEDKLEKSARLEGKTAWEIAEFYTEAFLQDYEKLQYTMPDVLANATDHIKEQIELVERLQKKGLTYLTSDGVYFDTAKFPEYGRLSTLDQIREGARVEINEEKHNPRDFALWKFSPPGETRHMEWDSPWGMGFPGWHIECSAMSMKYLGETFDIHTGGVDHISVHHTNEIAQSEAATGKQFVNYWLHTAFMLVAGEKMSKSLGNTYTIYDLEKEGYDPLALRYIYLNVHYRQEMNFTFPALEAAQTALTRLREDFIALGEPSEKGVLEFEKRFSDAINDDLNMPKALAVVWELFKADALDAAKAASMLRFDEVLGLDLRNAQQYIDKKAAIKVPKEVHQLIEERNHLRKMGSYAQADQVRNKIRKLGFDIQDTKKGTEIRKIS
jgi:cysteinyl-tRNA synthetase